MDCSDVEGLIVPYLLGALDSDEAVALESHVSGCRDCSRAMAVEMVSALAFGAPQLDPPSSVRERLLSRIESKDAVSAARGWVSEQTRQLGRDAVRGWRGAMVVVVVVAALALGVWFNNRLNEVSMDAERLSGELALARERESEVMSAVRDHREMTYELMRMSSTPGTSVNTLIGAGPWSSARGLVMVSYTFNRGALLVVDLPSLPPDKVYQIWLTRDGVEYSAGWFTVDSTGYGQTIIIPLAPFVQFDGMGITIEPSGGSSGPTGVDVLRGDL